MIGRFQSNLALVHWRAVKKVFRYLSNFVSCYDGGELCLTYFIDAFWDSYKDVQKSTLGYSFLLGAKAISWYNKKQSCIALPTLESQGIACGAVGQAVVWLRRLFQCLNAKTHKWDVILYCYRMVTLAYAKNFTYHVWTTISIHARCYCIGRGNPQAYFHYSNDNSSLEKRYC